MVINEINTRINEYTSLGYITANVVPAVYPMRRSKKNEGIVSESLLDLQVRYRVILSADDEGVSSYELTESVMDTNQIDMEHVRRWAKANAWEHLKVCTLAEMLGFPAEIAPPMFVITTDYSFCGAGAGFFCTVGLQEIARRTGAEELIILPSSISELIVIPAGAGVPEELNHMIQDINGSLVSPDEVLSDHCYYYNVKSDTIRL